MKCDRCESDYAEHYYKDKYSDEIICEDCILKQKVKQGLEDIEDYFDRLNGPDEDIEYIRQVKEELLEGGK